MKGSLFLLKPTALTLVEILLVVVILSVFTAMVVPNFSRSFSSFELEDTAQHLASLMQYAQGRAVTHQRRHRLEFDADFSRYWLMEETSKTDVASTDFQMIPGRMGRTFVVPAGLSVALEGAPIHFEVGGEIARAQIVLSTDNGKVKTISTKEQRNFVHVYGFDARTKDKEE